MDLKLIIILVLLATSYWQYAYPTSSHSKLEPIWGRVQDFVGSKNPLNNNNNNTNECPTDYTPVCSNNNITYTNTCMAAKAGVTQVTSGAC